MILEFRITNKLENKLEFGIMNKLELEIRNWKLETGN
jgi:hypothetical protein